VAVKAVLDTNIWVSAILNPFGEPARLLKKFFDGSLELVISAPLLEELADVLERPRIRDKYGITSRDVAELFLLIEERAEHVIPSGAIRICRDPDDDMVIEAAVAGKASFLVTRDDDLKSDPRVADLLADRGVAVLTVAKLLAIMDTTQ